MKYTMCSMFFCGLAVFCVTQAGAASLYETMQQGQDLFDQEQYEEALTVFVDA
ncbi:MAG: hypothetical protein GY868_11225, partial [Deltaproteobacteria bacterium]|nr:hypothetical protein [Deltaproteobacteria bacterium]